MHNLNITPQLLRDYLLGNVDITTQEILEESYFKDDEIFGRLLIAEDELIQDFIKKRMSMDEMKKFKEKYLSIPEGLRKFHFIKNFEKDLIPSVEKHFLSENRKINIWDSIRDIFFIRPVRWASVAAVAIVIFLIILPQLSKTPDDKAIPEISEIRPGITDLRFVYQLANEVSESKNFDQFKTRDITSFENGDSTFALSELDRYAINLKLESEIYLYIFQSDTFGNLTVLFPNSNYSDFVNPLLAGKYYRIPSSPNWWMLDQAPGIEEIELSVTSEPWIQMEKYIASMDSIGRIQKQYHQAIKYLIQVASNDTTGEYSGRQFSFLHKRKGNSK